MEKNTRGGQGSSRTVEPWSSSKKKVKQFHNTPMEEQRGKMYSSYSFTTSALDGASGQRHARAVLYRRRKDPGTHYTGGWVGPRTGLDTKVRGKLSCLCRGSNLARPVVQYVPRHYTD
jgi:hypothetical protein